MYPLSALKYNKGSSLCSRYTAGASFFPNLPDPGQVIDADFNPILWTLISPDAGPVFDIDPEDTAKLVCLIGGVYQVVCNLNTPSTDSSTYVHAVLKRLVGGVEDDSTQFFSWAKIQLEGDGPSGYAQSVRMVGYMAFDAGDVLVASMSSTQGSHVLGIAQENSSSIFLRRLGGAPGPG